MKVPVILKHRKFFKMTYVDDLVTGADSIEEVLKLQENLMELTKKAGLHLCKWRSNRQEVIEHADDILDSKLKLKLANNSKTLGVMWDTKQDHLCFEVSPNQQEPVTVGLNQF